MKKRAERSVFGICLVLFTAYAAWSVFGGLTDIDVYDWDEARHGVNAYEMMERGDCIVNTFDGEADYWNVKPPMSMWAIMLGYRIFGPGLLGLRFFSALSLPVTVAVMMLFLKRYVGSAAAITAGFLFAATGSRFIHLFRTGDPDALFFLFCMLAVMLLYMACKGSARWLAGAGLATAFAFLTKSMHVVVVFVAIAVTLLAFRKQRGFTARELLGYLVLPMALPVLIWAGLRMSRDGVEFFRQMLLLDVLNRTTTAVENHSGGFLFYPTVLGNLLGGWLCAGLFAVNAAWLCVDLTSEKRPPNDRTLIVIFGSLSLATLLIFTCSATKLAWYIYPCLIGLYTITGYAVQRLAAMLQARKSRRPAAVILSVGLPLIAIGGLLSPAYSRNVLAEVEKQSAGTSLFAAVEEPADLSGYVVCRPDGSADSIPQSWLCSALFRGIRHIRGGWQAYVAGETYVILKWEDPEERETFAAARPELQRDATSTDAYGGQYTLYR